MKMANQLLGRMLLKTSNGTITDMDGNFSLSISEGSQLSITYIGYLDQNVTVGKGKTVLNIQLREDMQALEEVVFHCCYPE